MSVTANGSADQGSPVTCHACERGTDVPPNRKWAFGGQMHCTTCHEDGHRAWRACGACLPQNHRWDRRYCSSTCRVNAHTARHDAALERAVWEAEHPDEAAKQRAEFEEWQRQMHELMAAAGMGSPEAVERRKRIRELKYRAARCAKCDTPFGPGEVVYRRGSLSGPVLPYCSEHRCGQPDGHHNRDAS